MHVSALEYAVLFVAIVAGATVQGSVVAGLAGVVAIVRGLL